MAQLVEQLKAAPPRIGKQGDPCVMVIFGAAGDLTGRLLVPALYNLARAGLLSREFAVLGVARAQYSDEEFRKKVYEDIKEYCGDCVDNDLWEWFQQRFYYLAGNFDDDNLYAKLKDALAKLDKEHSTHENFFLLYGGRAEFLRDDCRETGCQRLHGTIQRPMAPGCHREAVRT